MATPPETTARATSSAGCLSEPWGIVTRVDIAVLDDYAGVALELADWSRLQAQGRVDVFSDHVVDADALTERLARYEAVVLMRERTPLPGAVIDRLDRLRLIVTTGRRNPVIDVAAATRRGIVVSHTDGISSSTVELTWALILAHSRHLVDEVNALRAGGWQSTLGRDLAGADPGRARTGPDRRQGRRGRRRVRDGGAGLEPDTDSRAGRRVGSGLGVLRRAAQPLRRGDHPPAVERPDPPSAGRCGPGVDEADRAAGQHLPRSDRRRGRAARGARRRPAGRCGDRRVRRGAARRRPAAGDAGTSRDPASRLRDAERSAGLLRRRRRGHRGVPVREPPSGSCPLPIVDPERDPTWLVAVRDPEPVLGHPVPVHPDRRHRARSGGGRLRPDRPRRAVAAAVRVALQGPAPAADPLALAARSTPVWRSSGRGCCWGTRRPDSPARPPAC